MTTPETTLRAIDEALASGSAAAPGADLRELQELALLLRDDAPEPAPAFAARMAAKRFEPAPRRPALRLPSPRLPILAGAASVLLALVVATSLIRGGGEEPSRIDGAGTASRKPAPAEPQASLAPGAAEDSVAPGREAPPGGGGVAADAPTRRIERSAQLTLAAPGDEVADTADAIVAVADRHRGFVLRSETTAGDDPGGVFDLRIPESRFRAALADLSGLAKVVERSEQGQDVTQAYDDSRERIQEARSDRRGLLRRLERAETDDARDAIRRRLRLVSSEIRALDAEFRSVRERVEYAVVAVSLESDGASGGASSGGGVRDALDDAVASLEGSLGLALRALGFALPLAMLAGAAWLAAAGLRRRRREAALS